MNSVNERPPSAFTDVFISLNSLYGEDGFVEWYFEKGMRFGETEKWWGGRGSRTHPHEGVDFCFFTTDNGKRKALAHDTFVPPLYAGKVINVFDDFIAGTILLQHMIFSENNLQLYSLYGHVIPLSHIVSGAQVEYSEKMATIADRTVRKRPMLSHVHISTMWLPISFPAETFTWGMENKSDVFFCDPLHFLSSPG